MSNSPLKKRTSKSVVTLLVECIFFTLKHKHTHTHTLSIWRPVASSVMLRTTHTHSGDHTFVFLFLLSLHHASPHISKQSLSEHDSFQLDIFTACWRSASATRSPGFVWWSRPLGLQVLDCRDAPAFLMRLLCWCLSGWERWLARHSFKTAQLRRGSTNSWRAGSGRRSGETEPRSLHLRVLRKVTSATPVERQKWKYKARSYLLNCPKLTFL